MKAQVTVINMQVVLPQGPADLEHTATWHISRAKNAVEAFESAASQFGGKVIVREVDILPFDPRDQYLR